MKHGLRSYREVATYPFSAGGSRAANGDDAVLRASCRSNLYGSAADPTVPFVIFATEGVMMKTDDLRSPLWAVAIGTACLFAAMAAVLAFG